MPLRPRIVRSLFVASCVVAPTIVVTAACAPIASSTGEGEGALTGEGEGEGEGERAPAVVVGAFQLRLVAPVDASSGNPAAAGFSSMLGKVYDGPTPDAVIFETSAVDGDCRLLVPRVPFCATPCGGNAVCVDDDVCAPFPTAFDVGTVHVEGVHTEGSATGFDMTPIAHSYQTPADVDLPFPAVDEGADVVLSATGGVLPPFSTTTKGIAPLVLSADAFPIASGEPLTLSWLPPSTTSAEGARVAIKLDISHHGGTRGMITCDTVDDGTFAIAASLVDDLTALGVAGFPTIVVARTSTSQADVPGGAVRFSITSSVERPVTIDGLVSCTDDTPCTNETHCAPDLVCR